jgi:hypothetical protein
MVQGLKGALFLVVIMGMNLQGAGGYQGVGPAGAAAARPAAKAAAAGPVRAEGVPVGPGSGIEGAGVEGAAAAGAGPGGAAGVAAVVKARFFFINTLPFEGRIMISRLLPGGVVGDIVYDEYLPAEVVLEDNLRDFSSGSYQIIFSYTKKTSAADLKWLEAPLKKIMGSDVEKVVVVKASSTLCECQIEFILREDAITIDQKEFRGEAEIAERPLAWNFTNNTDKTVKVSLDDQGALSIGVGASVAVVLPAKVVDKARPMAREGQPKDWRRGWPYSYTVQIASGNGSHFEFFVPWRKNADISIMSPPGTLDINLQVGQEGLSTKEIVKGIVTRAAPAKAKR